MPYILKNKQKYLSGDRKVRFRYLTKDFFTSPIFELKRNSYQDKITFEEINGDPLTVWNSWTRTQILLPLKAIREKK